MWPDLIPEASANDIERMCKSSSACFGTPDEVTPAVEHFAAAGVDQLVFGMLSTTMSDRESRSKPSTTFGKHLLPQFDKDPEFSTAKRARRPGRRRGLNVGGVV